MDNEKKINFEEPDIDTHVDKMRTGEYITAPFDGRYTRNLNGKEIHKYLLEGQKIYLDDWTE